jgi:hypothetical protein
VTTTRQGGTTLKQRPDAVDLAYDKYGEHSIPLAGCRDNYLIVVDDASTQPPHSNPKPTTEPSA